MFFLISLFTKYKQCLKSSALWIRLRLWPKISFEFQMLFEMHNFFWPFPALLPLNCFDISHLWFCCIWSVIFKYLSEPSKHRYGFLHRHKVEERHYGIEILVLSYSGTCLHFLRFFFAFFQFFIQEVKYLIRLNDPFWVAHKYIPQ